MLARTDTKFDYATLPADKAESARAAAASIHAHLKNAEHSFVEIGRALATQKKSLGHGNYMNWVSAEFPFGVTTAHKFMKIAETFGANFQNSENISFEAWALLAAPGTPEPVREAVLERAASGEKVTAKEIDTLKKEHERTKKALVDAKGRLSIAEGHAESVKRQRDELDTKYRFASADKERLEVQLEELQDEIERLKDSDTIHVIREPAINVMGQMARDSATVMEVVTEKTEGQARRLNRLINDIRSLSKEDKQFLYLIVGDELASA